MNYLCIDYGDKHLGLAVATSPLAEPLSTIKRDQAISMILDLVGQYAIDTIVIGLSEGAMAEKTRIFARELQTLTDTPVDYWDETLTSQETRQQMAQMGMKKSRREAKIDHLVAAAILQDYLDNLPSSPLD